MSIFQALDPAAAFGQGQPHRPLHSHVLQCSLRQVTASLSNVFPANLLLLLFLNSQKKPGQQLCLVQVCNAQSLWVLPAVGAQLGIQVQSNGDMVWELFFYSSSAGRKAFWMKCATMQLTSLPCRRWRLLLKLVLTRFKFKVETDQFYKFFLPELKRDG